jgi:ABC-type multidrug transport system fused ATPase/permease subunit
MPKKEKENRVPQSKIHPLQEAGFFSKMILSWYREILWVSKKTPWREEFHYKLPKKDRVKTDYKAFDNAFRSNKSLYGALLQIFKKELILLNLAAMFITIVRNMAGVGMKLLISYITSGDDLRTLTAAKWLGFYCTIIIMADCIGTMMSNGVNFYNQRLSLRIRAKVYSAVQKKILKMSTLNSRKFDEGFLTNLVQVDCGILYKTLPMYFGFVSSVISVAITAVFMTQIGNYKLLAIVLGNWVVSNLPFLCVVGLRSKAIDQLMEVKDKRMTLFKNVVENMEYIKTNGLENYYSMKLYEKREDEVKQLKFFAFVMGLFDVFGVSGFVLSSSFTMISLTFFFGKVGLSFEDYVAFQALFRNFAIAAIKILYEVGDFFQIKPNLQRVNEFLYSDLEDKDFFQEFQTGEDPELALSVKNGDFKWKEEDYEEIMKKDAKKQIKKRNSGNFQSLAPNSDTEEEKDQEDEEFLVTGVNIEIKKGHKVIVMGKSSSGKSSLLYSMLGEMIPMFPEGSVEVKHRGKIAFLDQNRWLIGDTVRENITLGLPFDLERMDRAIAAAQMTRDVKLLGNGLDTMISDQGDNISGGQKARIGLARCFYQNPDVFILDDPTSSLDNKLTLDFLECINNEDPWKEKSFVISTNKVKFLEYCDKVLFMKNGEIIFDGVPEEFKKSKEYLAFKTELEEDDDDDSSKSDDRSRDRSGTQNSLRPEEQPSEDRSSFFVKEDRVEGLISWSIVKNTFRDYGGLCFILVSLFLLSLIGFCYITDTTLKPKWEQAFFKRGESGKEFVKKDIYIITGLIIVAFAKTFYTLSCNANHGRKIVSRMTFRLLHSKVIEYIQRTPIGILINRFSNDVNTLDLQLGPQVNYFTLALVLLISQMIQVFTRSRVIYAVSPMILFFIMGWKQQRLFINNLREVKRLEFISQSSVIGATTSTILGGPVIRSLRNQSYFIKKTNSKINNFVNNSILVQGMTPWFVTHNKILETFILKIPSFGIMILSLTMFWRPIENPDDADYADILIVIRNILQFSVAFVNMMKFLSHFELLMVSAERCNTFMNLELEEGYLNMEGDKELFELPHANLKLANQRVKEGVTRNSEGLIGDIVFDDVFARYPLGSVDILKGVNLTIPKGQKVGIVGRSGAGKSTLMKLFWRALEPSQGKISIGGVDISSYDLKEFRSQVTIILQKPSLFEGTIATNISSRPLKAQEVVEIRSELIELGFPSEKLGLQDLDFEIEPNGRNLSQSEKQIVCLMKSLREETQFVVMDEATAFVDAEMEKLFMDKIWERFGDCTLFMIAHRMSNVMNCDRVLVFDEGRVVEDGAPKELLEDKDGFFYSICAAQ